MKKILIAALVSTAFAVFPASAQLYIGAGAGEAKTDTRETSWKLYGGYPFTPTWGLELSYNDPGKSDIESWSLAGTARCR